MLLTTATILTEQIQFHIDADGTFVAKNHVGETLARADSLKRAKRLARFELKKKQVRVAVPFTMIDAATGKLTNAIAKGRHASSRSRVLIWIDDGTENGRSDTIELYRWGSHNRYLDGNLPPKAIKRIDYLFQEKHKTEDRLTRIDGLIGKWRDEHTIDLNVVLDAALQEAAEAMQDDEPPDTDEPTPDELDPPTPVSTDTPMELDIS